MKNIVNFIKLFNVSKLVGSDLISKRNKIGFLLVSASLFFFGSTVFGFESKNTYANGGGVNHSLSLGFVNPFTPSPFLPSNNSSSQPQSIGSVNVSVPPRANVGHGSSLSWNEAVTVSRGGRNYDFLSKKWGERKAFRGEKLNRFKLSWEANRKRSNAVGLPQKELYSKSEQEYCFLGKPF